MVTVVSHASCRLAWHVLLETGQRAAGESHLSLVSLCHEKPGQDATFRLFPPTVPREKHLHILLSIHSLDKRVSSAYSAQLGTGNRAGCKTSPNSRPRGAFAAANRKALLAEVGSACVSDTVATVSLNLNQLR